jgi:hypothetical protein
VSVMLLVYGDESMDETKQRVCAVAGVIGTELSWKDLERRWIYRINQTHEGIPFHATNCDSDQEEYKKIPHEVNKDLYRDLAILVADSYVCGFGQAIDLMALHRVFPEAEDISYYRAFLQVLITMKDLAKANEEIAEFTFDMRMESEHNAGLLYGSARENEPTWTPYLAEKITFEFARNNPRIQVADLLAREAMKALDNERGPVRRIMRKSWKALRDTGRFEVEAFSDEWFTGLKSQYAELEKNVRFCRQDYIDWLKVRNREHNITNLIHFMDWIARRDNERS